MRILRLAGLKFRRFRSPLQKIALVFAACVPLIYGATYLWSNWDPYDRLDDIPVAVVNADRPVMVNGQRVAAGELLGDELRKDPIFDWRFVDQPEADRGLADCRYYFQITVPADFSARLASGSTGTPERASMQIVLDDGCGYIVGKMAETVQSELTNKIDAAAVSAYFQSVFGNLDRLRSGITQASDGAGKLRDGANAARDGSAALATGLTQLKTGADQLAPGAKQVADGVGQFSDAVVPAANRIADALPSITGPAATAASTAADLTGAAATAASTVDGDASSVSGALTTLGQAHPELGGDPAYLRATAAAQRATTATGNVSTRAGKVRDGTAQLATGADQLATGLSGALEQIPVLSPEAEKSNAATLASPVNVETSNLHPANQYGRGLAPLFFGVAMWVFGIVAFLLLRPISDRARASRLPSIVVALGGYLPPLALGLVAAAVLDAVVDLGLGLAPVHPWAHLGLVALGAAAFVAIAHLLRSCLGGLASALILVLLILQLTACGGLYPVETLPAPFRAIHPFLPMSYLVDGLRVTISGGNTAHLVADVLVLAGFLVGALGLTWLVVSRKRTWTISGLKPVLSL